MAEHGAGPAAGDFERSAFAELADRYLQHLLVDPDPAPRSGRTDVERAARALERLAVCAAIARRVQAGWQLDAAAAVSAGASWEQVARARGQDLPAVREEFASWVSGQARLHRSYGLGLDPGQATRTARLLDPPDPGRPGRQVDGPGR